MGAGRESAPRPHRILFFFVTLREGQVADVGNTWGLGIIWGAVFSHCTIGVRRTKLGPSGLTVITGSGGVWGLGFGLRDGAQGTTFARQAPNH